MALCLWMWIRYKLNKHEIESWHELLNMIHIEIDCFRYRLNDMLLPNVIVKWIILVKYLSKSIVLLKLKSKEDQSRIGEKRK